MSVVSDLRTSLLTRLSGKPILVGHTWNLPKDNFSYFDIAVLYNSGHWGMASHSRHFPLTSPTAQRTLSPDIGDANKLHGWLTKMGIYNIFSVDASVVEQLPDAHLGVHPWNAYHTIEFIPANDIRLVGQKNYVRTIQ